MGHVVFLRGANVGGNNVFRPAELARALAHLDLKNVGAAGTFVVRGTMAASVVKREILARLPFAPAIAVCSAKDVLALVRSDPFQGEKFSKQRRGWVAVLTARPKARPRLPIVLPAGREWSVRFDRLEGPFALGLWQWRPKFVFPSDVVEDAVGVPATTRFWETLERIAKIIEG